MGRGPNIQNLPGTLADAIDKLTERRNAEPHTNVDYSTIEKRALTVMQPGFYWVRLEAGGRWEPAELDEWGGWRCIGCDYFFYNPADIGNALVAPLPSGEVT